MNGPDPVAALLAEIGLRVDVAGLDPDASLRDELEIDSIDFLNLVDALAERTGSAVRPEDYPRLATLRALRERLAEAG